MSKVILKLQNIRKSFKNTEVLKGLSLTLNAGDVYALLGPNGAGKTTIINSIMGFIGIDEGEILVDGCNVLQNPSVTRSDIAYLPETVMLHPTMTALENLYYFALLGGRKLTEVQSTELLTEAGLAEESHSRKTRDFSKGMRQKVGVAIALAKGAKLLLLDEPTSGMDASSANDFSKVVRHAKQRGMAILMVTHDLLRVNEIADHVGILSGGYISETRDLSTIDTATLEQLYLEKIA